MNVSKTSVSTTEIILCGIVCSTGILLRVGTFVAKCLQKRRFLFFKLHWLNALFLTPLYISTFWTITNSICLELGLNDFYCSFFHESWEGLIYGLLFLHEKVWHCLNVSYSETHRTWGCSQGCFWCFDNGLHAAFSFSVCLRNKTTSFPHLHYCINDWFDSQYCSGYLSWAKCVPAGQKQQRKPL